MINRSHIDRFALFALFILSVPGEVRAEPPSQDQLSSPGLEQVILGYPHCIQGQPVQEVLIKGCENALCAKAPIQRKLIALTDLEGLQELNREALDRARKRLEKTGFASRFTMHCGRHESGGQRVTLQITPQRYVRVTHISGNEEVYDADIRRRLIIEPGVAFTPDTPEAVRLIANQKDMLERLYREGGFDATEIKITSKEGDEEGIEVTVHIKEGRRKKIDKVTLEASLSRVPKSGDPSCALPDVDEAKRSTGVEEGAAYTGSLARESKRRVRKYFWSRGYVSPKVRVNYISEKESQGELGDEKGGLEISVTYQGCYDIRIVARDTQNDPFRRPEKNDLLEVLPFGESGIFEWNEAHYGRRLLTQYLQSQGYLFAKVNVQFQKLREVRPAMTAAPLKGVIRYKVTRGPLTEIRDITIKGLPSGTEAKAYDLLQTGSYDFFGTSGFLQIPRLLADLDRLKQHYQTLGYFGFNYPNARGLDELEIGRKVTSKDEVLTIDYGQVSAEIRRPRGESYIYVHAETDPGQRTHVGRIQFWGNKRWSSEKIAGSITLKGDAPYSRDAMVRSLREIRQKYQVAGFHQVKVRAECSSPERAELGRIACILWSIPVKQLSVHFIVEEGRRFEIGEIFWSGNFRTRNHIIERDIPKTGDPFHADTIREHLRKLRRLGVFSSVRPVFIGLNEEPPRERIALLIELHEAQSRFIDFAVGLETISRVQDSAASWLTDIIESTLTVSDLNAYGQTPAHKLGLPDFLFTLEAAYIDTNFLGRAEELQIPVKYGISTTEIGFPPRYFSFTPTWINRRFLGSDLRLRATPFFLYDRAFLTLDTFETGFETELSQRFLDRFLMALQYEISVIKTRLPGETFSPFSLQNKLRPQIALDFQDSPLNPTHGQYIGASVAYINEIEEGVVRNFVKYDLSFKFFRNIGKVLTVGVLMRYGQGQSLEGGRLPENERFVLGGNKGVRGYQDDGVFQYDTNGCAVLLDSNDPAGNTIPLGSNCLPQIGASDDQSIRPVFGGDLLVLATLELRFPILRRSGLWGTTFYDAGAIAEDLDTLNSQSFRQSVGFGIRYLIGNAIPLRLDYGIKLDRRCELYDDQGSCAKEESSGNLHFGILYTF
jgi:outer membrane protein assembly factor BamA